MVQNCQRIQAGRVGVDATARKDKDQGDRMTTTSLAILVKDPSSSLLLQLGCELNWSSCNRNFEAAGLPGTL
jgi:hypothetical protein